MKIIFLDMDGVMNSGPWMTRLKTGDEANRDYAGNRLDWWLDMIDPSCVAQLNRVVESTGAKVVISSTWRKRHTPEVMQQLLVAKGFTGEVIDRTPDEGNTLVLRDGEWKRGRWFGPELERLERGHEIAYWLHLHPEVESFVILDDDGDMAHLADRHVQTYWQHWTGYPDGPLGLDVHAADRAIAMLNGERDG